MQRVTRPEERLSYRRVICPGEPGTRRRVRVQIPEVLDAGNLVAQPSEDFGLKFMVIGAAAMRMFGVSTGRGKVGH